MYGDERSMVNKGKTRGKRDSSHAERQTYPMREEEEERVQVADVQRQKDNRCSPEESRLKEERESDLR